MTNISRSDRIVKAKVAKQLSEAEYKALAEFRYQLRRFVRAMEEKVREAGLNPQQYQLLLAIRGLPAGMTPTITVLADRMQLNHNSMVEMVDRCEERGLIRRTRSGNDRRRVTLSITAEGGEHLRRLASASRQELRDMGPVLVDSLVHLIGPRRNSAPVERGNRSKRNTKRSHEQIRQVEASR